MLNREAGALHRRLRRLTTYATIGAAVTSPAVFLWYRALGLRWWWALLWTVFSVIALPFALYHSWTFLTLAGTIIHIKLLDRPVSSRLIVMSQFGLWIGASVLIAFLLTWLSK